MIVYNGLASSRSTIVRLPVSTNTTYTVTRLDAAREDNSKLVHSLPNHKVRSSRISDESTDFVLAFDTGPLPPVGAAVLKVSMTNSSRDGRAFDDDNRLISDLSHSSVESRVLRGDEGDDVEVSNGLITARFDRYVTL